jgi:hypothetical protein
MHSSSRAKGQLAGSGRIVGNTETNPADRRSELGEVHEKGVFGNFGVELAESATLRDYFRIARYSATIRNIVYNL